MKGSVRFKFYGQFGLILGLILLWNLSWASSKFHLQDTTSQQINKKILQTQRKNNPVDSLTCDHVKPYFTNLRPWDKQREVDLFPTIRFTANDDDQHKDDDPSGIDTSTVFITIKTHPNGPRIIKARPHLVRFVDGFFKINYDFKLPQQLNYDDTVWVKLEANDLSRNKNYGFKQYRFYIKKDPVAPRLEVIEPIPFSTEISLSTPLTFFAKDNKNMLDRNSAQLVIQNQNVAWDKLEFIAAGNGDTIKYQPQTPFQYNEHITVAFKIADIQGNYADTTFWFDTIKDTTSPQIVPIHPLPADSCVDDSTRIELYAFDDKSGLDKNSAELVVKGNPVPTADLVFKAGTKGDTITYFPPMPFHFGENVDIGFAISDSAGNSADTSYSFVIETIPEIEIVRPQPSESDVSAATDIAFYIPHTHCGVDMSTVIFVVNSDTIDHARLHIFDDGQGDSVTYRPPVPFAWGEVVAVNFRVGDFAGNFADTSFSFTIANEPYPPVIEIVSPLPDANCVDDSSEVVIVVKDSLSGIDVNTVLLKINSQQIPNTDLKFKPFAKGDSIIYHPPIAFAHGDTVSINFSAADSVGNVADTSYSFVIETIPEIEVVRPQPNEADVSAATDIAFYIPHTHCGVDMSTVIFVVNSDTIDHARLHIFDDGQGDSVNYRPTTPFAWGEVITVNFRVGDFAGNFADTNFVFTTESDTTAPEIVAIRPLENATDVDDSTDIVLQIADFESGVDTSSIIFVVDANTVLHSKLSFSEISQGFEVAYQPATAFPKGWTAQVDFSGADSAGNLANKKYVFTTESEPDTVPPIIEVINPLPDEHCVDDSAEIVLFAKDLQTGIDVSTIEFAINGSPIDTADFVVVPNSQGIGDTIKFHSLIPFVQGDTISVYFAIADFAGNKSDTSYAFAIETTPEIQVLNPLPGDSAVAPTTDVVIYVPQTLCKIDTASYVISVDKSPQGNVNISFDGQGYRFQFVPANAFSNADTVNVHFGIADSVGNWADTRYYFVIRPEGIPPKIAIIHPMPNATNVDDSTYIKILAYDLESRIDTSSVYFKVNLDSINNELQFTKTPTGFFVNYNPRQPFQYGDTIHVYIFVKDIAGNEADTSYSFTIEPPPETIPPKIVVYVPKPNATGVDPATNIRIYTFDLETGVDSSTVQLSVDSAAIDHGEITFTKTPVGYFVDYQPANAFSYDSTVHVHFSVKDFAENIADTSYQYTIEPDTIPPEIEVVHPLPGALNVVRTTDVMINVRDFKSGIDTSTIIVKVDSSEIRHTELTIKPINGGYEVTYQPAAPFPKNWVVDIDFSVKDFATNPADTSYTFTTDTIGPKPDTIPPIIEVINPLPDEHCVDDSAEIVLFAKDLQPGIDASTVVLKVNNSLIDKNKIEITPDSQGGVGDTIKFFPASPFSERSTIKIYFAVSDFDRNKADTSYSFIIETMPVIQIKNPLADAIAPPSTDIEVYVPETPCKIDTNSYVFAVNDTMPGNINISFDGQGYRFQFVPTIAFQSEDTAKVYFGIADLAGNWAETSYSFMIVGQEDTIPPKIEIIRPLPNETSVNVSTDIKINAKDFERGIDTSTIMLRVDSLEIPHTELTLKPLNAGYAVTYKPAVPFPTNWVVDIDFSVKDFANNPADTSYRFTIEPDTTPVDTTPPIIEAIKPVENEVDVDDSTDISLRFYDLESAVDTASVVFKVSSVEIPHSNLSFSANNVGYKVTFAPPKPFALGEVVDVDFSCSNSANKTANKNYSFSIEFPKAPPDTIPPRIVVITPLPGQKNVSTLAPIAIYTVDDETGVDSTTIRLIVNSSEISIPDFRIENVQNFGADSVFYHTQIAYPSAQKILVRFYVEDFAGNAADTTYSFETGGAKIIVRSNPFTPNGDGINDEVEFNFEKLHVVNPVLKIFDLHNQIQKEITAQPGVGRIHWDGRDDRGRPLLPGIYFYILLDGKEPKTRGIVAIAK